MPHRAPLDSRYPAAVTHCRNAAAARKGFARYDAQREIFTREVHAWLFGGNPRGATTLTELARKIGEGIFPNGGLASEAHPGLREYLCLLHDDVRAEHPSRD